MIFLIVQKNPSSSVTIDKRGTRKYIFIAIDINAQATNRKTERKYFNQYES